MRTVNPVFLMAAPVLYLCSSASDSVTGERLVATEFAAWRNGHSTI